MICLDVILNVDALAFFSADLTILQISYFLQVPPNLIPQEMNSAIFLNDICENLSTINTTGPDKADKIFKLSFDFP